MNVEIIDETNPNNILSDAARGINLTRKPVNPTPESLEGFHDNPEQQRRLGWFIFNRFGIGNRGPLLDVGPGKNFYILEEAIKAGIPAYAIEVRQDPGWSNLPMGADHAHMFHEPRLEQATPEGIHIYSGDISLLGARNSHLNHMQFGLVLFNGSWASDGNNFTFSHEISMRHYQAEFRKWQEQKREDEFWGRRSKHEYTLFETPPIAQLMAEKRTMTLQTAKDHLANQGLICVVSPRYAFWGAGYSFEDLPIEKLVFLDLINRFMSLGSNKIWVVGMSHKGFDPVVNRSYLQSFTRGENLSIVNPADIARVSRLLRSVKNLCTDDSINGESLDKAGLDQQAIKQLAEMAKQIPALSRVSRIDAVFAQFS